MNFRFFGLQLFVLYRPGSSHETMPPLTQILKAARPQEKKTHLWLRLERLFSSVSAVRRLLVPRSRTW